MDDVERMVAGFDPEVPIERAWTPPSSWYTSDAMHAAEQHAVWGRAWQPVARLSDLAKVGSFTAGVLGGEPWVVVRQPDGGLAAFHNTCRHKGREVAAGSGKVDAGELVCGYHGWTYGLDGRLRSAPGMGGVEDFDRDAMCLKALTVDQWGPWAFLHTREGAPPLADHMAVVDDVLGGDLWSDLSFRGARSWTLACNWKVVVDNYLDGGYHVAHMHPGLAASLDMETYATEIRGESCLQTVSPAGGGSARIGGLARYLWIHPNLMLNRYGPFLDANQVVPLGPGRCEVRYEFFASPEVDDAAFASSMDQSAQVQREDTSICESVQRGLASSGYECGRYAPRLEIGEHLFHRFLHRDLVAVG